MYSELTEDMIILPEILQNYSEEIRKQFQGMFADSSVTVAVVKEKLNRWIESQNSQLQVTFHTIMQSNVVSIAIASMDNLNLKLSNR